eukprot:UN19910
MKIFVNLFNMKPVGIYLQRLSIDLVPAVEYVKFEVLFLWVRYNIAVTSASKRDIVHQKYSILATKGASKHNL